MIYTIYDGNGNVSELITISGAIAGHYEYDLFGGTIALTGSLAKENSFRFSTKYADEETKLIYYGYRYYSPELGRWLSRDPIGEEGSYGLFSFVENSPLLGVDPLGKEFLLIEDTKNKPKIIIVAGEKWLQYGETTLNSVKYDLAVRISSDPKCTCGWGLRLDSLKVIVRAWWVAGNKKVRQHEYLHIHDYSAITHDQLQLYLKSFSKDCMTEPQAWCSKGALDQYAGNLFTELANMTTAIWDLRMYPDRKDLQEEHEKHKRNYRYYKISLQQRLSYCATLTDDD